MRENKLLRAILLLKKPLTKGILLFTATVMAMSWLSPFMLSGKAEAAGQITQRNVTISSGVPSATGVNYVFSFVTATNNQPIAAIKVIACTTAIGSYPGGTCTAPTAFSFTPATYTSINSAFTDTGAFTKDATGATDCIAAANVLCLKRTSATNDTNVSTAKVLTIGNVTNPSIPSGNGFAYYLGITTYNVNTYTTAGRVDAGTVATAVVQTLTVSARVAEILQFCVGSTTVNDATTSIANDCTAVSGTSVNLGTLDSSLVSISPVTTNGGDSNNAVAMLRSNAANGATVSYDAIQAGGGAVNHLGTLRIPGTTCSALSGPGTGSPPAVSGPYTDPCIDAAGATQNPFTAGTEEFGMTIAGVNCGSTTSYTCTFSSGLTDLAPSTNYIGNAYSQGTSGAYGASATKGFAWDESGASTVIASSASSTVKPVDDEALILTFAATPTITTPFGTYSVQADFTAVPTY